MLPPVDPDVRMRGFARRSTVAQAWEWIDSQAVALPPETVGVEAAAGRVLACDVSSSCDVPGFDRSMMDGFAVRAADVAGAGGYNRLPLAIVGEALPGRPFDLAIAPGQAVRIMTGAPLPPGADAVLPAEWTEVEGTNLFALADVSPGKHIGRRGEDIQAGTQALRAGRRLRPQDVGLLSSIGQASVEVIRRPRVSLVVTGNELLPAGTPPMSCRIADANGPMLAALVARDGGIVLARDGGSVLARDGGYDHLVPDDRQAILAAMQADVDVVLVSGGSSVGQEDHAPSLLAQHGQLAIHGLAMRPSSPAGMGRLGHRLVFLLPGNPVSCLCAYDFFAARALRRLGGRSEEWPYRQRGARLARKISSTIGRLDYARVRLVDDQAEPISVSGASILSSTTRADGFVLVPEDSEGYPAGAEVTVFLYD